MAKRRIDPAEGHTALLTWYRAPESASRSTLFTAVRYTLEEIAELHPGRSVELRVPPAGATQILPGATHRRGTPPAVIEISPETWLELACGMLDWNDALSHGDLQASGQRTDLSRYLPLFSNLRSPADQDPTGSATRLQPAQTTYSSCSPRHAEQLLR